MADLQPRCLGQARQMHLCLYPFGKFPQYIQNSLARRMESDTTEEIGALIDSMLSWLRIMIPANEAIYVIRINFWLVPLSSKKSWSVSYVYRVWEFLHLRGFFFLIFISSMCKCFHSTCVKGGMIKKYYYPNYKSYAGSFLVQEDESWAV